MVVVTFSDCSTLTWKQSNLRNLTKREKSSVDVIQFPFEGRLRTAFSDLLI